MNRRFCVFALMIMLAVTAGSATASIEFQTWPASPEDETLSPADRAELVEDLKRHYQAR